MVEKRGFNLVKKPKNPIIIEGFPGFGLVGTIATGFLSDHLKCEQIGTYYFEEAPATLAVHGCKLVEPIAVYYNKKYNIVIVHSILSPHQLEWKAAELINDLCEQLQAKELITLEGVGSAEQGESRAFYFTKSEKTAKALEKIGINCLGEGIIVGVTSALLLKSKMPITAIFAETHSQLPDSKAAAKIVETLDKYLSLDVDYRPLLKQAEQFEQKLRGMLDQAEKSRELKEKKSLSYVG